MISREKWRSVQAWMESLQISEAELIEKFIIGRGKGGQKLHKTASVVYLKHVLSGLEVKCQDSRSREENRYFARRRLCEKLHAISCEEKTKAQQKAEKIRRQKKRRSRRTKVKMLEQKQQRATLKQLRKKPEW